MKEMPKGEQPGQEKEPEPPAGGTHSMKDRAWAALRNRIDRKAGLRHAAH
eukprot:gene3111-43285_t